MRLSVSFSGFAPISASLHVAERAEHAGLDGAWYCEHIGFHDAVVPAALMLDRFPGLDVGIVGTAPVSRHPALLAMELGSLAELGPGRVRAQLGLGDARLVGRIGGVANSLQVVREYVEATRRCLAGEPLDGQWANHVFDSFRRAPAPAPPALDVMAIRPRMLELAAEIADGVSLSTGASAAYLAETVERVERALEKHGRPRDSFRITAQAFGCIAESTAEAVARITPTFRIFSPQVLALLAPGLDPETDAAQMAIACGAGDLAERLDAYRRAGVDEIAIDLAQNPDEIDDALAAFAAARDA
ncbi:LLM class flavin-dependent oxidoreductase [Rhizohabitans arisaemae]|uniref:LLM class flavin-dependent oxidoreductase n=1 Tax=Rhizohabitans arisaemae TaxID=2720610 RepID=UPI0024B17724|nr:LLM class flavin-dependent oxidoreductase [Rhizohabitans arisaemae]